MLRVVPLLETRDVKEFPPNGLHSNPVGHEENWLLPRGEVYLQGATSAFDVRYPPIPPEPGPVYLSKFRQREYPSLSQMKYLWDNFFSHYKHEVIVLVGRKRDGKEFLFYVPQQEGTGGGVWWEDDLTWFMRKCRWVGTIHSHPAGCSVTPSVTDTEDWSGPTRTGLHFIMGTPKDSPQGAWSLSGSFRGRVFLICKGDWQGVTEPQPVTLACSGNKRLKQLINKTAHIHREQIQRRLVALAPDTTDTTDTTTWSRMMLKSDAAVAHLDQEGAICLVSYKEDRLMMTVSAYDFYRERGVLLRLIKVWEV